MIRCQFAATRAVGNDFRLMGMLPRSGLDRSNHISAQEHRPTLYLRQPKRTLLCGRKRLNLNTGVLPSKIPVLAQLSGNRFYSSGKKESAENDAGHGAGNNADDVHSLDHLRTLVDAMDFESGIPRRGFFDGIRTHIVRQILNSSKVLLTQTMGEKFDEKNFLFAADSAMRLVPHYTMVVMMAAHIDAQDKNSIDWIDGKERRSDHKIEAIEKAMGFTVPDQEKGAYIQSCYDALNEMMSEDVFDVMKDIAHAEITTSANEVPLLVILTMPPTNTAVYSMKIHSDEKKEVDEVDVYLEVEVVAEVEKVVSWWPDSGIKKHRNTHMYYSFETPIARFPGWAAYKRVRPEEMEDLIEKSKIDLDWKIIKIASFL